MELFRKFVVPFAFCYSAIASASSITTCLPKTTYDQYQAQGSCVSGNVMFSDFEFSSSGTGLARSASNVSFQPVSSQGLYSQINLNALSAPDGSSTSQQVTLSFLESAVAGSSISILEFEFNGTGNHGGVASVTEDYCISHPLAGCPLGLGGEEVLSSRGSPYSNSVNLPAGVTALYVAYTVKAVSGIQGTASVVQFENSNTGAVVPEPTTFPVVAAIILGLFAARRIRHWCWH
jgi:hypothetical protein